MGIATIPAPSSASAPFAGAGSLAVNAYSSSGYYTTTLAAGKYVIVVQNQGGQIDPQSSSTANNSGTSLRPKWNYADSVNDQYSIGNESGTATVVNLTTSATIFITNDFTVDNTPNGYSKYYTSNPDAELFRGVSNFRSANSDIDLGIPFVGRNQSNLNATRGGFLLAPTTFTGFNSNSSTVNQAARTSQSFTADQITLVTLNSGFMFIGDESARLYSSTDGATFSLRTTGLTGALRDVVKGSVAYSYVAVSSASTNTHLSSSTDGITWATRATGVSSPLQCITFGNNLYVAGGTAGVITTSTDGLTWVSRTGPQTSVPYNIALFNNGIYLLITAEITSTGVNAAFSTDGTTWTAKSITASARADALTAGGLAQKSTILTTSNSTNAFAEGRQSFAGDGLFWFQSFGTINVSTDAVTWSQMLHGQKIFSGYYNFGYSNASGGMVALMSENNGHHRKYFPTPAQYYIYNHTA